MKKQYVLNPNDDWEDVYFWSKVPYIIGYTKGVICYLPVFFLCDKEDKLTVHIMLHVSRNGRLD